MQYYIMYPEASNGGIIARGTLQDMGGFEKFNREISAWEKSEWAHNKIYHDSFDDFREISKAEAMEKLAQFARSPN